MISHMDFLDQDSGLTAESEDKAQRYALFALKDYFSDEMHKKLIQKYHEGYTGWDNYKLKSFLLESLEKHVERAKEDPNQWVDVANLAAMLWNFEQ